MITSLKRIFKLGWNNVSRNMGLSFVANFVIVLTLILVTLAFTTNELANVLVEDVRDRMAISVYFKDGVDEETISEVKDSLSEIDEVASIRYISKEDAFETFVARYRNNPVIMASLAEVGNPFLHSLSIKSETSEGYEIIAGHLSESSLRIFFEKIDYDERKDVIKNIFEITSTVQTTSLMIAIFLSLLSVSIVFNTVRLAIYGMKEEIKIMRLVGVSDRFIQGLFVMQGAIIGATSFLVAFLFVFGFGLLFGARVSNLIPGLDLFAYFKSNFIFITLMMFLIGVGLGKISSIIAVAKYLKD